MEIPGHSNLPFAVLSRWQRIQLVRDLSTAAAGEEEGGELGVIGSRYARVSKPGHEEQSRARRIQAGQIFERQVGISCCTPLGCSLKSCLHCIQTGQIPSTGSNPSHSISGSLTPFRLPKQSALLASGMIDCSETGSCWARSCPDPSSVLDPGPRCHGFI